MLTTVLDSENEYSLTLKMTNRSATKEFFITVAKKSDLTNEQVINFWSRRAKLEYIKNPVIFQRFFVDRINKRQERIINETIQQTQSSQSAV